MEPARIPIPVTYMLSPELCEGMRLPRSKHWEMRISSMPFTTRDYCSSRTHWWRRLRCWPAQTFLSISSRIHVVRSYATGYSAPRSQCMQHSRPSYERL